MKSVNMKQLFFTISFFCLAVCKPFAQSNNMFDSSHLQKIYFPAVLYTDSLAFEKQMPLLAKQVIAAYKEKNKREFFRNASAYYFIAGDYKSTIASIDSAQKIEDDASFGIEMKSSALAKLDGSNTSFEKTFQKEFSGAYHPLSFRKKVVMAFLDSSAVNGMRSDYRNFKEKLRKNNTDSLSQEEARSLAEKYSFYTLYKEVFPLISPLTNDVQYRAKYPAIKGYKWAGVAPVKDPDERPDPTMQYKLLMELTSFAYKDQNSAAKYDVNAGLGEVARLINLHEASGIPHKNMHVVVVVHGGALYALLNNAAYKKKYGVDNPNIALIKELQHYGANIIVCGQAMTFLQLEKEDLVPGIKQALTAQTVLPSYQLKNYVHYDLSLRQ